jgi:membrane associated rhomboid family serine protease
LNVNLDSLLTVTNVLIGLTVIVSFYAFERPDFLNKLIMNPYRVKHRREYYRFITSGFIHLDHIHIIFNMLSLYFFGTAMEIKFWEVFGPLGYGYFIALYILGIVVSDIPTYFKHRNNPRYNALGASGGVASVIFAFILFLPLEKLYLYFTVPIPGFILGVLYLFFSWHQGRHGKDNINHDAHLYGALFGLVFCIVLYPRVLPEFIEHIKNWRPSDYFR